MKCNLIVETNELIIRGYSLIEDEGLNTLIAGKFKHLALTYEEEEIGPIISVKGPTLRSLLDFVSFAEIMVQIIS